MITQAFDQGFIDKCTEYGVTNIGEVETLYKRASFLDQLRNPAVAALLGAAGGSALGAGGAFALSEGEDIKRNMLLAGLGGAGIGGLSGYGLQQLLAGAASDTHQEGLTIPGPDGGETHIKDPEILL